MPDLSELIDIRDNRDTLRLIPGRKGHQTPFELTVESRLVRSLATPRPPELSEPATIQSRVADEKSVPPQFLRSERLTKDGGWV